VGGFSDFLYISVSIVFAVFGPVAIVLLFIKRRRRKAQLAKQNEGPLRETAADLDRAEKALRDMPIDIREALVDTHDLYDRFSTHNGYSNEYMESLTTQIRSLGIGCELIFQATLPMGVADAIVEPQGVFELYVRRGDMLEARKTIPGLVQRPAINAGTD
jgi:hypothetical protein